MLLKRALGMWFLSLVDMTRYNIANGKDASYTVLWMIKIEDPRYYLM